MKAVVLQGTWRTGIARLEDARRRRRCGWMVGACRSCARASPVLGDGWKHQNKAPLPLIPGI